MPPDRVVERAFKYSRILCGSTRMGTTALARELPKSLFPSLKALSELTDNLTEEDELENLSWLAGIRGWMLGEVSDIRERYGTSSKGPRSPSES